MAFVVERLSATAFDPSWGTTRDKTLFVRHPGTFTVMTQKDVSGDILYSSPHWRRRAREFSVPQRQDETIIALRAGCTEVDRGERGNYAGGKWPPRRKRSERCSGHGVVLPLDDGIVKESEASTYRC